MPRTRREEPGVRGVLGWGQGEARVGRPTRALLRAGRLGPGTLRSWLLLEGVLDLFAGLLQVALGLVALAFGFHLLVADGLAGLLLGLALDLGDLVGRLILSRHVLAPHPAGQQSRL